ncbi:hypothetical protein F2Q69_00052313 [Brassica cretica]|uniref:Uncharacterized protein n=1 Tax=Brassica cretica TaxID=69181 RepID=A0A8S9N2K6_BRACR|nr:hypothetical protein F2Q69_00052313 [Brassica cretica]
MLKNKETSLTQVRDIEEQNKEHELDKGIRASAENHRDEEDLQLLTEEEINQIAEQYGSVNLKMDEDMLDEDDLLDEPEIPETQIKKPHHVAGQGQEYQDGRRVRKDQKDKAQITSDGKRRSLRSPDKKGLIASKKLANRGRASPKGKLIRSARLHLGRESTPMVPRTEVYPSAVRGRKSSTVSGSVGSQKPPSTHI